MLDDATYNGDVTSDVGTATVSGAILSWAGTVPVGGVAHITYSVTVKDGLALGDGSLVNAVTPEGCDVLADCTTLQRPLARITEVRQHVSRFRFAAS